MRIYIGSDHAGFEMKKVLVSHLALMGHEVVDKGPDHLDPTDDYPDFIQLAAQEVSHDPSGSRGIIMGGSGQGEAIVANRFPNVRCALYYGGPLDIVKLSREHNNANILSLGARFLTLEEAKAAVKLWLETSFIEEERHMRRIKKVEQIWPYR